jgi:adenylate cyclase
MAYFVSEEGEQDHAINAVHCAAQMQRVIMANQAEWSFQGVEELSAGIGITTGEEIVGRIGSPQRLEYTLIGPKVNMASRLADLTKTQGVDILVDERTQILASEFINASFVGEVPIRGFREPQPIYQVEWK